ncbi:hypothetical protein HY950_03040 [Candidatus Gottesmanbacteria bacterium]|nr:hypothetical protein [Candidatus Gottesmanbacteria bacterium]
MKQSFIASVILAVSIFIAPITVFGKSTITAEYALPYPGMLPDHPLYSIKALRDRIMDFLIVDPARKVEFSILQADKRLVMGKALLEKGNAQLAEAVVSKGEKYMHRAVSNLLLLKTQGKILPGDVDRLEKSLTKHAEVLEELIVKSADPQKAGFTGSLEFVRTLEGEVPKMK